MRISKSISKTLLKVLTSEAKRNGKPIVFIIHPNEVMDLNSNDISTTMRGKSLSEKIFADKLRQKLKLRCLGLPALKKLESIIKYEKDNNFKFITCKMYKKKFEAI
jgi:hypothetical protein